MQTRKWTSSLLNGRAFIVAATIFFGGDSFAAVTYEFKAQIEVCESCALVPIGSELLVRFELKDSIALLENTEFLAEDIESIRWKYPNEAISDRYLATTATGQIQSGEVVEFDLSGLDWLEPRPPVYSEACGCFVGIVATPTFFEFDDSGWSFGQVFPTRNSEITASPPRGIGGGFSVGLGWVGASGENFTVSPVPLAPAFLFFLPGVTILAGIRRKYPPPK